MDEQFQLGDLVKIKPGTEDHRMPDGRVGVIVERVSVRTSMPATDPPAAYATAVFDILFTNGETLKFHSRWLNKVPGA